MGTTGFNATFSSNVSTVLGAVLAGFGFWTKRQTAKQAQPSGLVQHRHSPSAETAAPQSLPAALDLQRPLQPLRVIRFIDADLPAANAGRMVISGRMSDVCAELDRLAA